MKESSDPHLAFASVIWTYSTSHLLGIYPALIVIIVHTQSSYISTPENTISEITLSSEANPPTAGAVTPRAKRRYTTTTMTSGSSSVGQIADVHVHELHALHRGAPSQQVRDDYTDDKSPTDDKLRMHSMEERV